MDLKGYGRSRKITSIRKRNAFVGIGILLAFGTQVYLTILSPMMNPQPYKDIRETNRMLTSSYKPIE